MLTQRAVPKSFANGRREPGPVSRVRQFIGDLKGEIDEAELGKRRSVGSKSEIA